MASSLALLALSLAQVSLSMAQVALSLAHVTLAGSSHDATAHARPEPEERGVGGNHEAYADSEVSGERREGEGDERVRTGVLHVAHARQLVGVDHPGHKHNDGLDGRHGPRYQMEVGGVSVDRLVTPAESGR